MKKTIALILAGTMLFAFSACEQPHTHTFSEEWEYDEEYHYHLATCGDTDEVSERGEHVIEEGKCKICGYTLPVEEPVFDSSMFSKRVEPASPEERDRAVGLIQTFLRGCGRGGFMEGDLFVKEHSAEGTEAQNLELRAEGFTGFDVLDGLKVSMKEILPSYGGTSNRLYYADAECAVEVLGSQKNYYKAENTAEFLIGDLFEDLKGQTEYASLLLEQGAEVSYSKDGLETVKVEKKTSPTASAVYVFVFYQEALAGVRLIRTYTSLSTPVTKQIELLIGDYAAEKPDVTGFNVYEYKPRWAAGYPTEEVFAREYLPASESQLLEVRRLFKAVSSHIGGKDNLSVLGDGDIRFTYRSVATQNDITFNRDPLGVKIHERSEGLLRSDEEGKIVLEHYADGGACYELKDGTVTAYAGNYAERFYSMMPYTLLQLCDFMGQYLTAVTEEHPEAYGVYVCEGEFQAVKLTVEGCAEMYYVFDYDGKLLAAKIEMNNASAVILTGKFKVEIPEFTDVRPASGELDIGYLGT